MTKRTGLRARMESWKISGLAACLAVGVTTPAFAYEPLTDAQLEEITAGAEESRLEEVVVNASHVTASGKHITAEGTLGVQHLAGPMNSADLLLRDSAQSDLQALINLNAVQSVVNVLVNLNINIDSQVGELQQINLASPQRP